METPIAHGNRAEARTIYAEAIPSRDDLSNIQKAVKHIIDYLSFRNSTSDIDEKIEYLKFAIDNINEEITSLRRSSIITPENSIRTRLPFSSPTGGKRKRSRTHKKSSRHKRRHTLLRK